MNRHTDKKTMRKCISAVMAAAVMLQANAVTAFALDDAAAVQATSVPSRESTDKIKEELSRNGNEVTQYENQDDHKMKTIVWAKGVQALKMDGGNPDFTRKEYTDPSGEQYIEYITPYVGGHGWYDVNKSEDRVPDQNLCFAAAASNSLHWWLEQNANSVQQYMAKNPGSTKVKELQKFINSFKDQQNSEIYQHFVSQFAYRKDGYWPDILQDQFINGYRLKANGGTHDSDIDKTDLLYNGPDPKGGYFYDVFGTTLLSQRRYYGQSYDAISNDIKHLFVNGNLVLLTYSTGALAHVVTLWGAEFNPDGRISAVYLSDSDDTADRGMARFNIVNRGGTALLSTNVNGNGSVITALQVLSLGTDIWNFALGSSKTTLDLVWGEPTFTYNGKQQKPTLTANNINAGDDISLTVDGAQKDAGKYEASAFLDGRSTYKYELPANKTFAFEIEKAKPAVSLNANPVTEGGNSIVRLTARVSGVNREKPNGTITFKDGSQDIAGAIEVQNGKATYDWQIPMQGERTLSATFTPAASGVGKNYQESSSEVLQVDFSKIEQTPIAITPITGKTYGDEPFMLETTGGSSSGDVVYTSSASNVIAINGNMATIIGAGSATITATKLGDHQYNSTSATYDIDVAKATPNLSLTAQTDSNADSPKAVLSVSIANAGSGAPATGTVKFINAADQINPDITAASPAVVENGTATYTWTNMPAQLHRVKAEYSGDGNYNAVSSAEINVDMRKIYPIVLETDGNGRASASPTSAAAGTKVTLSATPNPGFQLKRWDVLEGEATITGSTFDMPAMAVKIKASFEPADSSGGGGISGGGGGGIGGGGSTASESDETETITTADGTIVETIKKPDGTVITKVTKKDGSTSTTTVNKSGKTEAQVNIPDRVAAQAQEKGEAVPLPIPSVTVNKQADEAPVIHIDTGDVKNTVISVPVNNPTSGTAAVIIKADGTKEVIRKSAMEDDAIKITLPAGATIEIVDRSVNFQDVAGHWASDAINFVSSHALYNGTDENTFSPNAPMTRAMLVKVLHNTENNPKSAGGLAFSDVAATDWFSDAVQWAVEQEIVTGYDGGLFMPEKLLTREDLAVILHRYAGSPAASDGDLPFSDANTVSAYAHTAMQWAVENGIMNGTDNHRLNPKESASRAQVATMLMRFLNVTL